MGRISDQPHTKKKFSKIVYLIGTYPYPTTTFIDREIVEAKRQGLNIVLVSIRKPDAFAMRQEVEALSRDTAYLLPVDWLEFFKANLFFIVTKTLKYFSTLLYLLTRRHITILSRLKTILHFGEGVQAAWLLKNTGVDHIHAHFADRAYFSSSV